MEDLKLLLATTNDKYSMGEHYGGKWGGAYILGAELCILREGAFAP
jgi:hypothetical protein